MSSDPTATLDLSELISRAKVSALHHNKDWFEEGLDALRARIEAGYAKVEAAKAAGAAADSLARAGLKIAELEDELSKQERVVVLPWYFEDALLMFARDALRWSCVPEGSTVTVDMPGVYHLSVRLDNLPEEPPF